MLGFGGTGSEGEEFLERLAQNGRSALTSKRVAEITNAFLDMADDAEFRAKQMEASGVRLIQGASRSQSGGEFLDSKSKILKSTGRRFFLGRLLGILTWIVLSRRANSFCMRSNALEGSSRACDSFALLLP